MHTCCFDGRSECLGWRANRANLGRSRIWSRTGGSLREAPRPAAHEAPLATRQLTGHLSKVAELLLAPLSKSATSNRKASGHRAGLCTRCRASRTRRAKLPVRNAADKPGRCVSMLEDVNSYLRKNKGILPGRPRHRRDRTLARLPAGPLPPKRRVRRMPVLIDHGLEPQTFCVLGKRDKPTTPIDLLLKAWLCLAYISRHWLSGKLQKVYI